MQKIDKLEAVFWGIALPGFPQLLAGSFIKGVLFVSLEILINVMSHFNKAIMLSFLGQTEQASEVVDYQWLMFYPCLYMFALWDAYKTSIKPEEKFAYLPFAFCAYFVTIGLMFAPKVFISGKLIGPVFLPMFGVVPGILIGLFIKQVLIQKFVNHK
ncbi:hypothetical protein [Falsibacillus albus]|uniref:Uncharacterized protein n=1 Tax=Falsibacillus albus TaxID=2478915 RepID=A0A3L7K2T2_9BACI|nr:hypothetical protein [Falsibacillus albus]RLQ97120.1 hypothetical protein D9X91_02905 [Falsibacillus albus]